MVTPKLTTILTGLLLVWMGSKSVYRKEVMALFTAYVVYLAIKMFIIRYRRPAEIKTVEEAAPLVEAGDLIHICAVNNESPFMDPFNLVCMFFNENDIHTAYAIEYNSKLYVMNAYATFLFNRRKPHYKDPSSVIVIESDKLVSFFMEPVEEFLRVESVDRSYLTIVKTEKKARVFDVGQKVLFGKLKSEWWKIHCCKVLAKYLESQGVVENRSGYTDFLYYTPDVLRQALGMKSRRLIQMKSS
jgi:hypothetical protein